MKVLLSDSLVGEPPPNPPGRRQFCLGVVISFAILLIGLIVTLAIVRSQLLAKRNRLNQTAVRHRIALQWTEKYPAGVERVVYIQWLRNVVSDYFLEIRAIDVPELTEDLPPSFFQDLSRFEDVAVISWRAPRHSTEVVRLVARQRNLHQLAFVTKKLHDRDLECLAQCSSLHTLEIDGLESNDLSGRFLKPMLARPMNLQRLVLHHIDLCGEAVECLGRFGKLEILDLTGSQLPDGSNGSWTGLSRIRDLILDETALQDAFCATLGSLKTLRSLSVKGTLITGKGLSALESCPGLTRLQTGGKRGGPDLLSHVKKCQRLVSIDVVWSGTFTPEEVADFNAIPDVTYLYFADIGDDEAKYLAQCEHLTGLDIHSERLSLQGVRELMRLPDLRHLKLAGTAWGPDLVDVLYESPSLEGVKILGRLWEWWEFEDLRQCLAESLPTRAD